MLAIIGCDGGGRSAAASASASASTPVVAESVPASSAPAMRPALPADPPAPVASLAHEAPGLEAKLAEDAAYQAVWDASRVEERRALLTAVGQLAVYGGMWSPKKGEKPSAFLEERKLRDAAVNVYLVWVRTNRFPGSFEASAKKALEATRAEPRMGTWGLESATERAFDFTSVAALLYPEDPAYERELIAARAGGFMGWQKEDPKKPWARPYLADHQAALERLAVLAKLTPEEQGKLDELKRPRLGKPFKLGAFRFVVDSVNATDTLGSGLAAEKAPKGGMFIVVTHRIENTARTTATIRTTELRIVDKQGREFSPSSRAAAILAMSGEKDFMVAELQPGLERTIKVPFEVPADVLKNGVSLVVPELFGAAEAVTIPLEFGP